MYPQLVPYVSGTCLASHVDDRDDEVDKPQDDGYNRHYTGCSVVELVNYYLSVYQVH